MLPVRVIIFGERVESPNLRSDDHLQVNRQRIHATRYKATPALVVDVRVRQNRSAEAVIDLCNSAHCEIGESRPSPSPFLDKTFFLQAYEYPVTDDDVIENLDPDLVARLYQLFRRPDVLLARLWVA